MFCSVRFFPPPAAAVGAATIFHFFAMHNSKSGLIYLVQLLLLQCTSSGVVQEKLFCFFELMAHFFSWAQKIDFFSRKNRLI